MKKELLIFITALTIIFAIGIINAEDINILEGECYNFKYLESIYNSTTNTTLTYEKSQVFCATSEPSNTSSYCSVLNRTMKPGERFTKNTNTCNLDITCETNASFFEHEINYDVSSDYSHIFVTIESDTKSFPRSISNFGYSGSKIVMCPFVEPNLTIGDPQSLDKCLGILEKDQGLSVEEKADKKICESERDSYKVEMEIRGNKLDNRNSQITNLTSELKVCVKDVNSAGTTNWILLIFFIIFLIVVAIIIVANIRKKSGSSKAW